MAHQSNLRIQFVAIALNLLVRKRSTVMIDNIRIGLENNFFSKINFPNPSSFGNNRFDDKDRRETNK
jgi:hypothetical protein